MTNTIELVDKYFQLAPLSDSGPYFAQFTPGATVEAEGHEYHGVDAIRAWREDVPSVSYAVLDVQDSGSERIARAEIAGDFPGSPVTLAFHFTFAEDGRIESLAIR